MKHWRWAVALVLGVLAVWWLWPVSEPPAAVVVAQAEGAPTVVAEAARDAVQARAKDRAGALGGAQEVVGEALDLSVVIGSSAARDRIPRAVVRLRTLDPMAAAIATCTTSTIGECTMSDVVGYGPHVLEVTKPEHRDGHKEIWLPFGPGTALVLLTPDPQFQGQVLDDTTGGPIARAVVEADQGHAVHTDAMGRFSLARFGLHPEPSTTIYGRYYREVSELTVAAVGYEPVERDLTVCDAPCTVRLKPRPRRVRGLVLVDLEGRPRPGVQVFEAAVRDPLPLAVSDEEGQFEIPSSDNCIKVRLEAPGAETTECSSCTFESEPATCTMGDGGSLFGKVLDASGRVAEGAEVEVQCSAADYRGRARSGADGTFAIAGTPLGSTCKVTIEAQDHARLEVEESPPVGPRTYQLSRGAELRLRVRRNDGLPIGRLSWTHQGPSRWASDVLSTDTIRLAALSPGEHTVKLKSIYLQPETVQVELAANEQRTMTVTVTPAGALNVNLSNVPQAAQLRVGNQMRPVSEGREGSLWSVPLGLQRLEILDAEGAVIDARELEVGAGGNMVVW